MENSAKFNLFGQQWLLIRARLNVKNDKKRVALSDLREVCRHWTAKWWWRLVFWFGFRSKSFLLLYFLLEFNPRMLLLLLFSFDGSLLLDNPRDQGTRVYPFTTQGRQTAQVRCWLRWSSANILSRHPRPSDQTFLGVPDVWDIVR